MAARAYAMGGLDGDAAAGSPLVVLSPMIAGGANQAGVRLYNERLLLSLVRHLVRYPRLKSPGRLDCPFKRRPQL